MSKPNTTCRVCGTQYFCCGDSKAINSWRTMACTPECFKEYMRRIEESRKTTTETVVPNTESIVEEPTVVDTNTTTFSFKKNKTKKTSEENTEELMIED